MTQPLRFWQVGKQGRRPFLDSVAVQPEPALAAANRHIGRYQRVGRPILSGDQPMSIALSQPKRGEDDSLRCCGGNQLAQDQCRKRHDLQPLTRDCLYPL